MGIGFGAVIGGGIFVVTGVAASIAGPAIVAAVVIAAAAAACNALSSAELAARYAQSGGAFEYGYQLLGAWPGFVAGWAFLEAQLPSPAAALLSDCGGAERRSALVLRSK